MALEQWHPNLGGLGLPKPLTDAIRTAYDLIYSLSTQASTAVTPVSVLEGTHAVRLSNFPAARYPVGSQYVETDTGVTYIVTTVGQANSWSYYAGTARGTLAKLTTGLGTSDTGYLYYVTDYDHTLRWSGSGWAFVSGERSGYVQGFLSDPSPSTGWQLLDGSTVNRLNSDGTTSSVTLPDLVSAGANAAYLKFGSPTTGAAVAAIAPALTMNSYTPAGTNSAPALTMNSYTPAGTISTPTFSGNTSTSTSTSGGTPSVNAHFGTVVGVTVGVTNIEVFNGAGDLVHTASALPGHTHDVTASGTVSTPSFTGTPATLTGTVAAPVFTGTPAVLTGTISTTGEPRNLVLRPWYRR